MKEAGYVYILTNPSFKEDWVKIGKSSRPVDIRSKELDNTAVPLPFEIYATLKTVKYSEAEKLIHHYIERFTKLRIRDNREFFNVSPEDALAILKDVALVLDDAEIEEVFKNVVAGNVEKKGCEKSTPYRAESKVWLLPANSKYFDISGCLEQYSEIYWSQYYNIQAGDVVYLYSASPDSRVKYKFDVVAHDVKYTPDFDRERGFYVDEKDFESSKAHNRFLLLRRVAQSDSNRMSLVYLMEHGLAIAPRGAICLSHPSYKGLLDYIESNF